MWQVTEQDFDGEEGPGRIVVTLGDGIQLSIISPERTAYIRMHKSFTPSGRWDGWAITDVQAHDGEYEIGVLDNSGEFAGVRIEPEPEAWAKHAEYVDEAWIYTNVPPDLIDELVTERGLSDDNQR